MYNHHQQQFKDTHHKQQLIREEKRASIKEKKKRRNLDGGWSPEKVSGGGCWSGLAGKGSRLWLPARALAVVSGVRAERASRGGVLFSSRFRLCGGNG